MKSYIPPDPIQSLQLAFIEDKIVLSWEYPDKTNLKGFIIQKANTDNESEFKDIMFLDKNTTLFEDKNFIIGKQYFYKIKPINIKNIIQDSSPPIFVKPNLPPIPPSNISYKIDKDSLKIFWSSSKEPVTYNIYKSYKKSVYHNALNNEPLNLTSFKDGLEPDKTIYYSVRALIDKPIKYVSKFSEELQINPSDFIPSKPLDLKYVISENKIHLIWKANSERWLKGYNIYRKKISDDKFILIGQTINPVFTDISLLNDKMVYYITANGPIKESLSSESIEVSFQLGDK